MKLLAVAAIAAVAALATGTGSAQAGTIAAGVQSGPISAYSSSVAWLQKDAMSGQYFLTATIAGKPTRLPLPEAGDVYDIDLGPGPDGSIWLVYSRCKDQNMLCRLYRYAFGSAGEVAIPTSGPENRSDGMPAIWGNRVAFVRGNRTLLVRDLKSHRQQELTLGSTRICIPRARCVHKRHKELWQIDLKRRTVAFMVGYDLGETYTVGTGPSMDIYIARIGRRGRLIGRGYSGETSAPTFSWISFGATALLFGSTCQNEECDSPTRGPARVYSYAPAGGAYRLGKPARQFINLTCWQTCVGVVFDSVGDNFQPLGSALADVAIPRMRATKAPIDSFEQ